MVFSRGIGPPVTAHRRELVPDHTLQAAQEIIVAMIAQRDEKAGYASLAHAHLIRQLVGGHEDHPQVVLLQVNRYALVRGGFPGSLS